MATKKKTPKTSGELHEHLSKIGRKGGSVGGKATGKKGLAAMSPEERRAIQQKAWAKRRKKTSD